MEISEVISEAEVVIEVVVTLEEVIEVVAEVEVISAVVVTFVVVVISAVAVVVDVEVLPTWVHISSGLPLTLGYYSLNKSNPFTYRQGEPIPPPNTSVTKTENDLAKALTVSGQKTPRQAKYPERPGYGTVGRPVTLYANYLPLTLPNKRLFRYHISIAADSAGRSAPVGKKARHIVRLLLEEHFPQQKNSIASDFRSTLVSCVKLTEGKFDVRYKEHLDDDYIDPPRVHQVTCQYTGEVNPADLVNYLTSTNAGAMLESKSEIVAALNMIMGHHPKTDDQVVSVGANKHYSLRQDTMESFNLGGGLSVLRGFFVSVRAATARVLLNVQVKYLACYNEGPLANVIQGYNSRSTHRLEKFLKSLRVRITHISRKNSRGQPRPRIRPIYGLASLNDGRSSPNPPIIKSHGAGPQDVQFFLAGSSPKPVAAPAVPGAPESKGKKGKKVPKAGPAEAGRYITVADFFKKGPLIFTFLPSFSSTPFLLVLC